MTETAYHLANGAGRLALRALGVRPVLHGLEHVPTAGPVVLAATHSSFLDFLLVERGAVERGRYVRFLTRHDIWEAPFTAGRVGAAMDAMGHVPVDRTVPAAALLRARSLLRAGEAVGIFPEAGISYSFTVRALMRGTAALAAQTGAPVVPVALWGAHRVASVGDPRPPVDLRRGRPVDIAFGAAMHAAPDADPTGWTQALGERLTELLEGLQRLPQHRPRPGEHASWYPAHLGGHAPTRARAALLESVPRHALSPSWGPAPGSAPRAAPDAVATPPPGRPARRGGGPPGESPEAAPR